MIVFLKYLTYFTTYIINIIKFLLESTLYHPWIVLQSKTLRTITKTTFLRMKFLSTLKRTLTISSLFIISALHHKNSLTTFCDLCLQFLVATICAKDLESAVDLFLKVLDFIPLSMTRLRVNYFHTNGQFLLTIPLTRVFEWNYDNLYGTEWNAFTINIISKYTSISV